MIVDNHPMSNCPKIFIRTIIKRGRFDLECFIQVKEMERYRTRPSGVRSYSKEVKNFRTQGSITVLIKTG